MPRRFFWASLLWFAMVLPPGEASAAVNPMPYSIREPAFSKNILNLLNDADKAIKGGHLREALNSLNLAVSLEPNNPYLLARFAVALNMAGDFENARDRLRRAKKMGASDDVTLGPLLEAMLSLGQNQIVLDLYPDPGPDKRSYAAGLILRARASAMQVMGDSAGASAAMARSLSILKDYDGLTTAGRIALMQGAFDAADAHADEALKIKPGDIDAWVLKINLAIQKQMPGKAQEWAEYLVKTHPRSMAALLTRIKVYLSTDRADKAEADIDRVLVQEPDLPLVRYFKAVVLARHNDVKGAWDIAHSLPKEFVQIDPGVGLNVANMAVAAGFQDSGASILNVVVNRFPYQMDARLQLVDLRLRQNSPQYAQNLLQLVKDSNDPRVTALFARIAVMKKDAAGARLYIARTLDAGGGEELRALGKDLALKSLRDYSASHPGNIQARKQYAILLLGFGELTKARALYEQFVRDDPADGFSLNNLAWLVVQADPRRALMLAQQAVKANPGSPDYLDTLGSMQMNAADHKGAVVSLQKAHSLRPDDPGITYHLALALEASGSGAQSTALLQALVKRGGFSDLDAAKNLLASKLKMAGQTQLGR